MVQDDNKIELLLYCLRSYFKESNCNEQKLSQLVNKGINWDDFLSLGFSNRVIPLIERSLESQVGIPDTIASTLKKACRMISARNLLLIAELKRLLILLYQNNFSSIPFKGPLLGIYYNNPGLRMWTDLDIIIKKEELLKIEAFLNSEGYQRLKRPGNGSPNQLPGHHHAVSFYKESINISIDLHWRLTDSVEYVNLSMERIWEIKTRQWFFDLQIEALNMESVVISTCIHHGVRNSWNELKSIVDLAVIFQNSNNVNWTQILGCLDDLGIKRALLTGASLVDQLLDVNIPSPIDELILKDPSVKKSAFRILHEFFGNRTTAEKLINNLWNRIQLRDRFFIRLRLYIQFVQFLIWYILSPNTADKELINLPYYLHFVYYIVRPFRLMGKFGRYIVVGQSFKN